MWGMTDTGLTACLAKMTSAGVSEAARDVFSHYYRMLEDGATGLIREDSISPLLDAPKLADVTVADDVARDALAQTVVIKLNGGLGTSMGLDDAKTLLGVRDGKTFLDFIVAQVRHVRETYGVRLPLLLMDSFRTQRSTLAYLRRYPDLAVDGLPLDFLQNAEPKVRVDDLMPVSWPANPELEWCPPGHGDLYTALWGSGLLRRLLDAGFRYASVANGDNLGAAPDPTLAGWFASTGAPYAAEVCVRTANDRKGGHLAIRRSDGRLILRDTAQTAPEEMDFFTDEYRHPYFHANNLWFDLQRLDEVLTERHGVLALPMIRNEKNVNPSDPSSPKIVQLETAMGAAIEVFEGAQAIVVDRDRFLPVKTTDELMLVRSDAFELGVDGRLRSQVEHLPEVRLDPRHYKFIDGFNAHVPVTPSLREASSLIVEGEWLFDEPSRVVGDVHLTDQGAPSVYRSEAGDNR